MIYIVLSLMLFIDDNFFTSTCMAWQLGRLPLNEVLAGSGAVRLAWEAYGQCLTTFSF